MCKQNKILIVDDDRAIIDILMETLNGQYEVCVALNGTKAIEVAHLNLPDLILLDIMMPNMDGYQVCQKLKENSKTENIPIVFITSMDNAIDERKGLELGAADYITKPISQAVVQTRVKNQLALKNAYEKLTKQNQQLKAMLQLREDMAHMIVHDMRVPLSSISGFCNLISMRNIPDPKLEFYMDNINDSINELNSFINDLLILAKSEQTELILNLSEIDIEQIFQKIEKTHTTIAKSKDVELIIKTAKTQQPKLLDGKLFQRALDNLVSNAIKFAQTQVVLEVEYINSKMVIKVQDDGVGISKEEQARVFEPFVVGAYYNNALQIGLGLAFCKAIVSAHKGKIDIVNLSPRGTLFIVEV